MRLKVCVGKVSKLIGLNLKSRGLVLINPG